MSKPRMDEVDRLILKHLSEDARLSNREIALALGLAEGTVRARIKRLQENNIIKIMALTSFSRTEQMMMAYLGVRIELAHVAEAARAIARLPFVRFTATMLGRFDVLAITIVKDGNELVRLVNDEIMTLPGVRHADTSLAVKTLKYDYRWGRILTS